MSKNNFESYANLSDNQLYKLIGEYNLEFGFSPPSTKELIRLGKAWYNTKKNEVCKVLCESEFVVQKIYLKPMSRKETLALTIADIITTSSNVLPVPPFIIAVLILREGIDTICKKIN